MKLYQISAREADYGSLELFNTQALIDSMGFSQYRKLRASQSSIADIWPDSYGCFYDMFSTQSKEIASRPDVYIWMGVFLVLSAKAKDILNPLLRLFGEHLPFECGGKTYYVFSVHTIIEGKSDASDQLVFEANKVGTHKLFKTNSDSFSHLYCTDEFQSEVVKNKLVGIDFSVNLSISKSNIAI